MRFNWKRLASKKAMLWLSDHTTPLYLKQIGWEIVVFISKCGQSHPASFVMRLILGHNKVPPAIGLCLMLSVVWMGFWEPYPVLSIADTGGEAEVVVVPLAEDRLVTTEAVQTPLKKVDISQRFWLLHAGVDIRTPVGTPIYPVMAGRVTFVQEYLGRSGYGKYLKIKHNNGYESLYGHLSKIYVVESQEVNLDTQIAESGNTGRSTGPHLHLEIRDNEGKLANPLGILGLSK